MERDHVAFRQKRVQRPEAADRLGLRGAGGVQNLTPHGLQYGGKQLRHRAVANQAHFAPAQFKQPIL